MKIGIDASRAFLPERTGIEEYSFQVIRHLEKYLENSQVVLYVSANYESSTNVQITNKFPKNWRIKIIKWRRFWTQIGLSLEMLFHPVDVLFVPSHTVPWVHPKNTILTVHGLEYEKLPEAYSFWERFYMRLSIKNSCRWAEKIVTVSENTKKDLMELYKVPEDKIEVIHEGVEPMRERESCADVRIRYDMQNAPYLLFIGRLEERKNIIGIIRAFEILKEHYKIPHKLVLAGKFGYGEEKVWQELKNVNFAKDIILPGFVSDEEKRELLKSADIFLFPTFYEGFGLPVLEAQNAGVPVVAGDNSSIKEITSNPGVFGCSVLLVDPKNAEAIADAVFRVISEENLRKSLIEKGFENVKRFSWDKCAGSIARLLER